jgi:lysozyme
MVDSLVATPADFETLKERLRLEEGYRSYIYKDTRGNDTVGYGHLVSDGFSRPVADAILYYDIMEKEAQLIEKCPEYIVQCNVIKSVILDSCFNLGVEGFMQFKHFFACLNAKDYQGAANALRNSSWYKELPSRVEFLAKMVEDSQNVA